LSNRTLTLLGVGDIVLGPNGFADFEHVVPVLRDGDVVVGQFEFPHSSTNPRAVESGRHPDALKALSDAGIDVVTMAGNHLMDEGVSGLEESIAALDKYNITHVGAGMNIMEARKAAIFEREGTTFGFLNYNCVGPEETWAGQHKPGNAYVGVLVDYQTVYGSIGGPPIIRTWCEPNTLRNMQEDIRHLRPHCDVLIVAFHKGIGHTPIKIADYEREVSHAAVDAGADVVFAHHAHILKGIEVYQGKTIYHGLCNFVTYVTTGALNAATGKMPPNWAKIRKELFGFEPDPEYPTYPFHPDARYTMIAKCEVSGGKIVRTGFIPVIVNKKGQPVVVTRENGGQEVFDYMVKITEGAELNGKFAWDGDELVIVHE